MKKRLADEFLPNGTIGRDGVGVGCFKTNIQSIFKLFKAFSEKTDNFSGIVYPYELDRFTIHKKKKKFFRPTDVIYTADSIVSNKNAVKKADYYVGGLYYLFVSCRSFTIDTTLIGTEDIALIGERTYFVIPANKKRLVKKVASFTAGLRKCGVVTSDGMVRFIGKSGIDEFESASLPSSLPVTLEVNTPYDFNAGCFDAFAKCLEINSPCRFPCSLDGAEYSDRFSYKLGYLAVSSRGTHDTVPSYFSVSPVNCAGFYVSVIILENENGVFPFEKAFSYIPYLKSEANNHSFFAYTAVYGDLEKHIGKMNVTVQNKMAMPESDAGYIVIISDTPTGHSHVGFMNA